MLTFAYWLITNVAEAGGDVSSFTGVWTCTKVLDKFKCQTAGGTGGKTHFHHLDVEIFYLPSEHIGPLVAP